MLGIFLLGISIFILYSLGYFAIQHIHVRSGKIILKIGILCVIFGLFSFLLTLNTSSSQYYNNTVLISDFDIIFIVGAFISLIIALKSTVFVTWLLNTNQGSLIKITQSASTLVKRLLIILLLCISIIIASINYNIVASNNVNEPISVSESPNGKYIATPMFDGQNFFITVWTSSTGVFLKTLYLPDNYCQAYTYSYSCNTNYFNEYLYWSTNSTELALIIQGEQNPNTNNSLIVWNIESGKILFVYEWSGSYTKYSNIVWTENDIRLAYWMNNTIQIYSLISHSVFQDLQVNNTISQQKPIFSSGGNLLTLPIITNLSNMYQYGLDIWELSNQNYVLKKMITGTINFLPATFNDYVHGLIFYPVQWSLDNTSVYVALETYSSALALIKFNISTTSSFVLYKNASVGLVSGVSSDNTIVIINNNVVAINNGTIITSIPVTMGILTCNHDGTKVIYYKYPNMLYISDIYTNNVLSTININLNNFYIQLSLLIVIFCSIIGIITLLISFYKIITTKANFLN